MITTSLPSIRAGKLESARAAGPFTTWPVLVKRKPWQRRLFSFGRMTQRREIRMLICDCCSALRMARLKQRNAKRRCL